MYETPSCLPRMLTSVRRLRPLDLAVMGALAPKVNLIPVIAKGDTLSAEELNSFKTHVRSNEHSFEPH